MGFFESTQAVLFTFHALAISSTCFRLLHRLRVRRLWWDDFWALVSLLSDVFLLVVYVVLPSPRFSKISLELRLFSRISTLITYTCALWAARVSVGVTIVRLVQQGRFRKIAKGATIFLGMMWVSLMLQKIFMCGKVSADLISCRIAPVTGILELSTDLVGDIWLLIAPAYMLWQMKLPRNHHRLLLTIFACGILNTAASIVHTTFILINNAMWVGISGHLQVSIALIICNLLVVVTRLYQVVRGSIASPTISSTESTMSRTQPLQSTSPNPRSIMTLTDVTFGSTFNASNSNSLTTNLSNLDSLASRAPISDENSTGAVNSTNVVSTEHTSCKNNII